MPRENSPVTGRINRLDLRNSIRRVKDTKHFQIDKLGRFTTRFFSILLCFITWYFLTQLEPERSKVAGAGVAYFLSRDSFILLWFLTIFGPIVSIWNIVIYMVPFLTKAWSSRKILVIETGLDIIFTILWFCVFVYTANISGKICSACVNLACNAAIQGPCNKTNWIVAFSFFITVTWIISLVFDAISFYKGMFAKEEVDPETLLEIQRTARLNRT